MAMTVELDQHALTSPGRRFMWGTGPERIYREVKAMMSGDGSEEIMKDLAARQLSL